jgi:hypothetical protein
VSQRRPWQAEQTHWRGRVEHVGSQEVGYVQDMSELVCFIERRTGTGEKDLTAQEQDPSSASVQQGWTPDQLARSQTEVRMNLEKRIGR